jgi:hypothetical protein
VRELLVVQERADLAQLLHDERVRLPDREAAEKRQRFGIMTVALHRIQHLVVRHAVLRHERKSSTP